MSSRESYEAKVQSEFGEIQSQLSALATRTHQAVAASRAEGERLLQAVQSKHDEALHRFEVLKRAGEDNWVAVKTTFETAWTELRDALGSQG
jgi:hypothetical protein